MNLHLNVDYASPQLMLTANLLSFSAKVRPNQAVNLHNSDLGWTCNTLTGLVLWLCILASELKDSVDYLLMRFQ